MTVTLVEVDDPGRPWCSPELKVDHVRPCWSAQKQAQKSATKRCHQVRFQVISGNVNLCEKISGSDSVMGEREEKTGTDP